MPPGNFTITLHKRIQHSTTAIFFYKNRLNFQHFYLSLIFMVSSLVINLFNLNLLYIELLRFHYKMAASKPTFYKVYKKNTLVIIKVCKL